MALTAARTELNVSLVGEDETMRMLEDAKKRMGELEAKTRSLTNATQAQAAAAKASEAASGGLNNALGSLGGSIAAPLEGVGKLKEALSKGIEIFGFVGAGISGLITAYTFLNEKFNDTVKESDRVKKALEAQAEQAKETASKTRELAEAQQKAVSGKRSAEEQLISEQLRLAKLEKDAATMAALERQLEHTKQMNNVAELAEQIAAKNAEIAASDQQNQEATARHTQAMADLAAVTAKAKATELSIAEKKAQLESLAAEESEAAAMRALQVGGELQALNARNKELQAEALSITNNILIPEKARAEAAAQTATALRNQKTVLESMLDVAKKVGGFLKKALTSEPEPEEAEDKPKKTGGGRGKSKAEREREAAERKRQQRIFLYDLTLEDEALEATRKRLQENSDLGDKVLASYGAIRERIVGELASLPTDATSAAFEPLRNELKKQLEIIDKAAAGHREMQESDLFFFDVDAINKTLDAFDAEAAGISKVDQALQNLNNTRQAALEKAEEMAEVMQRASIADTINAATRALEGLSAIQAPALEAITASVEGLNSQFAKFKDGQTSLASAIVGSAGAIAGAVANKVLGVREEAGVRALFETAMGIATAFTNPLESAGHFAAAAAFGAVSLGGFKSTPRGGDGGGNKAPKKEAMATREGALSGGGGQVTNVYNLNTGIVDGQSTAQAFRRAEMQARNTGMASAGGW